MIVLKTPAQFKIEQTAQIWSSTRCVRYDDVPTCVQVFLKSIVVERRETLCLLIGDRPNIQVSFACGIPTTHSVMAATLPVFARNRISSYITGRVSRRGRR